MLKQGKKVRKEGQKRCSLQNIPVICKDLTKQAYIFDATPESGVFNDQIIKKCTDYHILAHFITSSAGFS